MAVLRTTTVCAVSSPANITHELKTPLTAISGLPTHHKSRYIVEGEDDLRNWRSSIVRRAAWRRLSTTSPRCLAWTRPDVQLKAKAVPFSSTAW